MRPQLSSVASPCSPGPSIGETSGRRRCHCDNSYFSFEGVSSSAGREPPHRTQRHPRTSSGHRARPVRAASVDAITVPAEGATQCNARRHRCLWRLSRKRAACTAGKWPNLDRSRAAAGRSGVRHASRYFFLSVRSILRHIPAYSSATQACCRPHAPRYTKSQDQQTSYARFSSSNDPGFFPDSPTGARIVTFIYLSGH